MEWVNLSRSFRLEVEHFADGWGWSRWEEMAAGGWRPLPPPALENARRRFRFRPQAEEFFCLLAELLADSPEGTLYRDPLAVDRGANAARTTVGPPLRR